MSNSSCGISTFDVLDRKTEGKLGEFGESWTNLTREIIQDNFSRSFPVEKACCGSMSKFRSGRRGRQPVSFCICGTRHTSEPKLLNFADFIKKFSTAARKITCEARVTSRHTTREIVFRLAIEMSEPELHRSEVTGLCKFRNTLYSSLTYIVLFFHCAIPTWCNNK